MLLVPLLLSRHIEFLVQSAVTLSGPHISPTTRTPLDHEPSREYLAGGLLVAAAAYSLHQRTLPAALIDVTTKGS